VAEAKAAVMAGAVMAGAMVRWFQRPGRSTRTLPAARQDAVRRVALHARGV
jgi:hypothetical protein